MPEKPTGFGAVSPNHYAASQTPIKATMRSIRVPRSGIRSDSQHMASGNT